ncbi:MAG: protein kinase [Snowella sp.]|nr:protein kinase [Snowella sp.]
MNNTPLWGMLEGQVIKDQYYLQQVLGAGTFGGVFRTNQVVRDTVLRTLATKVIFINQPELVSYQLQELQIALSFDHPHLLRCYDAGEAKIKALSISCLYLLMELAEETLENRLNRGNISKEEVKSIVKDIAKGLAYLHQKEQVHLDLKPANILKVNEHWKIGDYGLVRSLNPTRSYAETIHLLGTPLFSPPESYQGILSPAWDMWSLGIIIVMLLTSKYPIRFQTQYELQTKISNADFDNLNWNNLEQPWRKIVEGCLQVDRKQRWTAEDLLLIQFKTPLSEEEIKQKLHEGIGLGNLQKFSEALICFEEVLSHKDDEATAWFYSGLMLEELGNLEQAISHFDKCIEIDPEHHKAKNQKLSVLYLLGRLEF